MKTYQNKKKAKNYLLSKTFKKYLQTKKNLKNLNHQLEVRKANLVKNHEDLMINH